VQFTKEQNIVSMFSQEDEEVPLDKVVNPKYVQLLQNSFYCSCSYAFLSVIFVGARMSSFGWEKSRLEERENKKIIKAIRIVILIDNNNHKNNNNN
jgi:hypothetical protein